MSTAITRPSGRFSGRHTVGVFSIAVFVTLFVLVRLAWPPLARLDRSVAAALDDLVADHARVGAGLITVAQFGGNAALWWLITVGVAALLILGNRVLAAYVAVSGLGALTLTPLVTLLAGQPGHGFPSGHAMNAAVFGGLLLPALPRRYRGLIVGAIVAVGVAQVALGRDSLSGVVAGWLLGSAWLVATTDAFRPGDRPEPVKTRMPLVPGGHTLPIAVNLVGAWVLVAALLVVAGRLLRAYPPDLDEAVPRWLAGVRTPWLTTLSDICSQAGNTHTILAVSLVVTPLAVAYLRSWWAALYITVVMVGELGLFLTVAAAVGRPRPLVPHLDGQLPTASFPSGHVAATMCLWGAIAVLTTRLPWRWTRWSGLAAATLMPATVSLSRVYRGEHHPLDVAGGIALGLLWLLAVTRILRPARRPATPVAAPAGTLMVPADRQHVAVVANPARIRNLAMRRAEVSAALGVPTPPLWLETTQEDPGRGQTHQAVAAGADVVLAMGGDGTVMACADALVGTEVALGIVPLGTGNLLAGNLGIPNRLVDAVTVAAAGRRRHLDVGNVDGRHFTVMAGMGFDAQMLHDAPAALKARIGWPAYAAAALRHLCGVPMNVAVSLDGAPPIRRRARTVLIANVGGLPRGLRLLPDADPEDGVLDVAILMPARRRNWLSLGWALMRRRRTVPAIETFRAKQVTVSCDRIQPRELDGDLIEPSDRLTATVCPAALWICVP